MGTDVALAQLDRRQSVIQWAESIIQQRHYESLELMETTPLDLTTANIKPGDVTCLFRITELVFNKNEGSLERLTTVLNALHAGGISCLMMLQCQNARAELYLGAVNKNRYDNLNYLNTIRGILRTGIEGNLPGTELQELVSRQEIENKLAQCLDNGFDSQCVTAISCVPGDRASEEKTVPGIENLLEAVGRQNFTLMVLADPVSREQMRIVRQGYEDMSTQLSSLSEMSVSFQSGKSTTISENISETLTDTVTESISLTQSHTSGTGWSKGTSRSQAEDDGKTKAKKGLAVAAGIGITQLGKLGETAAKVGGNLGPFFAMQAVSTLLLNPVQSGTNDSESGNESDTHGKTHVEGTSQSKAKTTGIGKALAETEGITVQTRTVDKHTTELLNRVDWYLKWLNRCENYGMFNSCAYVISSNAGVNLMVASQYQALMQGSGDMGQPVSINTWTRENGVEHVKQSLLHMMHPVLSSGDFNTGMTPAMLLSSRELSRQMALPQKSVVGVSVVEYASFGREIVRKTPLRQGKVIRLGAISHMGKTIADQPVLLDLQSLTSHTFVAGTNGSGKSNTVFRMLEELMRASIPFMVIEPAKGEYKNVFGHEPNVKVYGTNKKKTELLRLNPFWFNEDIDIKEHIDKLVAVFNASWSMSAAMPQVLQSAIENAYRSCGWDMDESECKGGHRVYPTVQDVLDEFHKKMDSTAFSDEVKGNYEGALTTRMESLSTGIYGQIFNTSNLSDEELFDSNVIVDLSRVGSAETKAMIMGILVIRLVEYRMRGEAENQPLQHVAILEEAHHLLRRTSMAQSDEGSNLLGKSVEMISTAIAEMRSYGQGFMIVDQSPGLLDSSVIKNTNTKIMLRLPESEDREIVGRSMGLTPEQIFELSRLKTGVCAIYQKDSLEAVLCQVDRAKHEAVIYRLAERKRDRNDANQHTVKALLSLLRQEKNTPDVSTLLPKYIIACSINGSEKRRLLDALRDPAANKRLLREMIFRLSGIELQPPPANTSTTEEWFAALNQDLQLRGIWSDEELREILGISIQHLATQDSVWEQAMNQLPMMFGETGNSLRESRGRALSRITPLFGKTPELTSKDRLVLEKDLSILMESGEIDIQIANLLRRHLNTGHTRKQGELKPYTGIVWTLMGGDQIWKQLHFMIEERKLGDWDEAARKILARSVSTDRNTQTALLSLFLQSKGSLPEVKAVFHEWLNLARK